MWHSYCYHTPVRGDGVGRVGVVVLYWIHFVRPSIRPSVYRRHCFRSVTQVCLGISISNFVCLLFVAMGRSLFIFSDVTFKMAAWQLYWICRCSDYNFSLDLNIKFTLHWRITCVYRKTPIDFQICHFQNGRLVAMLKFSVPDSSFTLALNSKFKLQ